MQFSDWWLPLWFPLYLSVRMLLFQSIISKADSRINEAKKKFFFQNVWKPNVQGGAQYDLYRNSRKNAVRNSKYFYSHMQTVGPLSLTSPHPFSAISLSGHWPPSVSAKPSWVYTTAPLAFAGMMLSERFLNEWMDFYTMIVLIKHHYYFDTKTICSNLGLILNSVNVLLNPFRSLSYCPNPSSWLQVPFSRVWCQPTCSSFNPTITACRL